MGLNSGQRRPRDPKQQPQRRQPLAASREAQLAALPRGSLPLPAFSAGLSSEAAALSPPAIAGQSTGGQPEDLLSPTTVENEDSGFACWQSGWRQNIPCRLRRCLPAAGSLHPARALSASLTTLLRGLSLAFTLGRPFRQPPDIAAHLRIVARINPLGPPSLLHASR